MLLYKYKSSYDKDPQNAGFSKARIYLTCPLCFICDNPKGSASEEKPNPCL